MDMSRITLQDTQVYLHNDNSVFFPELKEKRFRVNMRPLQKCAVCGSGTHYRFYGAIACDPCRAFFRRHAVVGKVISCKCNKDCKIFITQGGRLCRWCRFQKCLAVGMDPNLVEPTVQRGSGNNTINSLTQIAKHTNPQVKYINSSKPKSITKDICTELVIPSKAFTKYINHVSLDIARPKVPEIVWLTSPKGSHLHYQVISVSGIPCQVYEIVASLDISSEVIQTLLDQDLRLDSFVKVYNNLTFLNLETCDGHQLFYRDIQSMSNVYVSIQSPQCSSMMILEDISDDHWTHLQEVTLVSKFFRRIMLADYSLQNSDDSLKPSIVIGCTGRKSCKFISDGIESLSIFHNLCLEDQIIVLKESFSLVILLLMSHTYDEKQESFVFSALKGSLSFCICKNRFLSVSYGTEMHEFYSSFLNFFYDFLRNDFFVIIVLCILCVLEDRPGLSCTNLFEIERQIYGKILDSYIKGKITSQEWLLERDTIWHHIHQIRHYVSKYSSIRLQYERDQERAKLCDKDNEK